MCFNSGGVSLWVSSACWDTLKVITNLLRDILATGVAVY